MKISILFSTLILLTFATCSGGTSNQPSPQTTFEALVTAIKARDLDAYTQCWYPERMDKEGEVARIKEEPETWDELVRAFQGSLTLVETGEKEEDGKAMKRFHVNSPDVEDGIGTITMILSDGKWLMYSW